MLNLYEIYQIGTKIIHLNQKFLVIQLNIPSLIEVAGLNCSINLKSTNIQYTAELTALPGNEKWQINQEGKIIKL